MNKDLQDHVWSVLPKEFKEEVKEEYFACKHCSAEASAMEIEIIFGEHNLTSDAEGEEMLTGCREDEAYRMTTDGHAYIVIKTDCGVGMVHDPDCPCREKGGSEHGED